MGFLENRVALVTGASKGIGRAIAICFAEAGADVIVNYNSDENGAIDTARIIEGTGRKAHVVGAHVGDAEQVKRMFGEIKEIFGRLDILVNNAGITKDCFLMMMKDQDWQNVIDTNLNSLFFCSKEAVRMMMSQKSGNIVNITSITGVTGQAGQTNYGASKGGIISFTKSLAREVGAKNIRVNAIAPGFVETQMIKSVRPEILGAMKHFIPMQRFGTPEEVAGVALFLACDLSSYMTGQVINVNGGQYM
ncbi:MAG: 3-oxoacyl-[acyl-carrier-protein] reductase [Oligoflexales bacterium]|nr:3-oxoacyl-[acyl-carrier-protein] reductase [Oligoflexales bacterium]